MRILILFDKSIPNRKVDVDTALTKIETDYAETGEVAWIYEDRDFSQLRWVEYQTNYLGIAWDIITKDINAIQKDKYDQVIYLISEENWKSVGIGGWNLGPPINGFCVEIVRIYANNPEWLYKTFAMEIAHSWNDMCIQELGDNLLSTFGVTDFDNMVVHGLDPRYGKLRNDGTYFTNYEYAAMIAMVKEKLKLSCAIRKARYENPSNFVFTKDLYFGLRNNDVLELQKRFVKEGLATYAPTGYFGLLTLASARAYQTKHAITPALGYVGPKTRARLNLTTSPVPTHLDEL